MKKRMPKVWEIEEHLNEAHSAWEMGTPVMSDTTWAPQYPSPGIKVGSWHGRPDSIKTAMNAWAHRHVTSGGYRNWLVDVEYKITNVEILHYYNNGSNVRVHFAYKFDGEYDEVGVFFWHGNSNTPQINIRDYGSLHFNRKLEKDLIGRLSKKLQPQLKDYQLIKNLSVLDTNGNSVSLISGSSVKVLRINRTDSNAIIQFDSNTYTLKGRYYLLFTLFVV